jgi:hypothetical protein
MQKTRYRNFHFIYTLRSIAPINLECFKDYRVSCSSIETVVNASSHYEAAFKTAVVFHENKLTNIDINKSIDKTVMVYQSNGDFFNIP